MTDPVSAWAFGAIAGGAVGFWIGRWWPRFTRYNRMQDPDWRRSFSHENINRPSGPPPLVLRRRETDPRFGVPWDEGPVQRGNGNGGPTMPKPPIAATGQRGGHHRCFINNPVQIAECGGPCTEGPQHCDCGALWMDVPINAANPYGYFSCGYQPRPSKGTPNPPPSAP